MHVSMSLLYAYTSENEPCKWHRCIVGLGYLHHLVVHHGNGASDGNGIFGIWYSDGGIYTPSIGELACLFNKSFPSRASRAMSAPASRDRARPFSRAFIPDDFKTQ